MLSFVSHYFPEFTTFQLQQLEKAMSLHLEWNEKINLISRKDAENIEIHHYLHSLSILKFLQFQSGDSVLDVGTGGGFPGIPLAITNPDVNFVLLDSVKKKLNVVQDIVHQLEIKNIKVHWGRIEDYHQKHSQVIARAVTALPTFYKWVQKNGEKSILYIKGGDFTEELAQIPLKYKIFDIQSVISEPFFETKKIVQIEF